MPFKINRKKNVEKIAEYCGLLGEHHINLVREKDGDCDTFAVGLVTRGDDDGVHQSIKKIHGVNVFHLPVHDGEPRKYIKMENDRVGDDEQRVLIHSYVISSVNGFDHGVIFQILAESIAAHYGYQDVVSVIAVDEVDNESVLQYWERCGYKRLGTWAGLSEQCLKYALGSKYIELKFGKLESDLSSTLHGRYIQQWQTRPLIAWGGINTPRRLLRSDAPEQELNSKAKEARAKAIRATKAATGKAKSHCGYI